ncbi:MAG TPA: hypothetical protein DCL76_05210 [Chloroflexi bacterium]|nr:hypothetical protein [Chloroflexota bacterium]|tara:strand:- start:1186 stop:2049 length:864 start_codon:yes stop_codon:yes gene_type:complete
MTWRTVIATLATFLTTIVVAFWLINEPARMQKAEDGFAGRSMEAGAIIYANNCTRCHGPQGEGLPGLAPALNTETLFDGTRITEVGWAGTLQDFVYSTISGGRPLQSAGTTWPQRMPTWSTEYGGPLRHDQVRDVTAFVMNWGRAYDENVIELQANQSDMTDMESFEPVGIDIFSPELPAGNPDNGETLTVSLGCTACHIQTEVGPAWLAENDPDGKGIGTRANERFLSADYNGMATNAEEYLRESIVRTNDYVVEGYEPGIMVATYGEQLTKQDLSDIISYLLNLK